MEVTLRGTQLIHGMVINFNQIKKVFNEEIHEIYDHHFLNDIMPGLTTAENMSKLFYDIMKNHFQETYKIRIYETPTSWVEYIEDTK